MALPTLRLSAPGLDDLAIDPFDGWIVQVFDPGDSIPREVAEDAPDADGTIDTTQLSGARNVTLGMILSPFDGQIESMEYRLKAFLNPRLRPLMYVTRSDGIEKQMTLRRQSYSGPIEVEDETAVVVQWSCPSGILESAELHEESIIPDAAASAGLEFTPTLEFDPTLEFPLVEPAGTQEIVNAGDRDAYPVIRAFGPFGDEGNAADETEIGNVTSGKSLVFVGMGVAAGDYLEIDFRRKTILVNGLAAQSRYSYLVFPDSEWFTLTPGTNEITFRPDTFTGNAQASIRHRDAYS